MLVSIIVNCHNGEKYLKQALDSVLNQTYEKYELIFFNNCSNDNSKKIFKNYKDSRFKYFESKKLSNLSIARNAAIKKSKGDLITFLDCDDWWDSSRLEKQINLFNKDNDIKFIYTDFYEYLEKRRKLKLIKSKKYERNDIGYLLNNYDIGLNSIIFKKRILNDYSIKFNPLFHIIGDFDLIIKISLKEKIHKLNEPLSYYRIHNNNETNKKKKLHILELKKWYLINSENKKIFSTHLIKNNFFNKITYLKNILLLENNKLTIKNVLIEFNFSIYTLKIIILFILKKIKSYNFFSNS